MLRYLSLHVPLDTALCYSNTFGSGLCRDLKPQNCFIARCGPVMGDMETIVLDEPGSAAEGGTPNYKPPEYVGVARAHSLKTKSNGSGDVYSMG